MKQSEAFKKECPIMSHRAPLFTVMQTGDNLNAHSYTVPIMCTGSKCMSWVSTSVLDDKDPEGYCQLIKQQKITIQ